MFLAQPSKELKELLRAYIMSPSTDGNKPCADVYIFDGLGYLVICIHFTYISHNPCRGLLQAHDACARLGVVT